MTKRERPATRGTLSEHRRDDGDPAYDVDIGSREHYEDAALYDYEYRRRRADVWFYRELTERLVQRPGPILELGCGSGRVAIPLARAGFEVIGLDISASMLARARDRLSRQSRAVRERVSLIRGDARTFALDRQFPLIIMAFNSFEHLYTRVEVEACLSRVREHLVPGGYFVFDVDNPDLAWLSRRADKRWSRTKGTHPETGRRFVYTTNHEYDPVSQIVIIRLYYQPLNPADGPEQTITLSQRKFFPAELEGLIDANRFRMVERFGDFDGEPLDGHHDAQLLVCQPRASSTIAADASVPGTQVMAPIVVPRDDEYMYFIKRGDLWRMPYGQRRQAERVRALGLADDSRSLCFIDEQGRIVRAPRSGAD